MAYTMRAAGAAIAFGYGAARVIPAPVCVDASDTDTKICAQTESLVRVPVRIPCGTRRPASTASEIRLAMRELLAARRH
jgi:hypothetical protein